MKENQKRFSSYIFLSTFARALVEVFIPLILYKFGYDLKSVVFYFFVYNLFEIFLSYPLVLFSKKYGYKSLAIIGFITFIILQFVLTNISKSIYYILLIAVLYSIYRSSYWLSRRYFNLKVIEENHISKFYSIIAILNQLGLVFASYIGSLFLDYIGTKYLFIFSFICYFISIIFLFLLKFDKDNIDTKLDIKSTFKKISLNKIYLFGTFEYLNVLKFFFVLYLFIYVKDTYQTIGIANLVTNLSVIIFAYFYGKKIDGEKNYLKLSILLVVVTYLFKANTVSFLLVLIYLMEGISTKMYDISINKEVYKLGKRIDYNNYNLVYEIICKCSRFILLGISLFIPNLKFMIYVALLFIFCGLFVNVEE